MTARGVGVDALRVLFFGVRLATSSGASQVLPPPANTKRQLRAPRPASATAMAGSDSLLP
eukprot:766406-Hanusia_phi.AAC.5